MFSNVISSGVGERIPVPGFLDRGNLRQVNRPFAVLRTDIISFDLNCWA